MSWRWRRSAKSSCFCLAFLSPAVPTFSATYKHFLFYFLHLHTSPHLLPSTSTPPLLSHLHIHLSFSPPTFFSLNYLLHEMYRGSFAPPPAQSPPLHHPIPQHVSTVPMMRSPPPPSQQTPNTAGYGGNPYQPSPQGQAQGQVPGQQGQNYGPGFGGFMTDPTAQMGFQVGKSAMMAGQEYMEQNVSCPLPILNIINAQS